jgi:nucleotide sugar dehydrogenase
MTNICVCVVGVGFVGEHLVKTFNKKFHVIGVDTSPNRIKVLRALNCSKSNDNQKFLSFQDTYSDLTHIDAFLISVPTLVTADKQDVDMSYLLSVRDTLLKIAKPGALIMVESSVYVGATRELFKVFLEKGIYVGFSPERVDPGRTSPAIEEIPKIISGLNDESLRVCKSLYEQVFINLVPVSSCECAEMCKLYENCFRMVNIAYVNEISDMCDAHSIDAREMIKASSSKPFGFMPFSPGLGVGGHCIPVNPYYLLKNGSLPVLHYSTKVMEMRPKLKAIQIVNHYSHADKILVIGIGFKKGECLTTNSPGLALYQELYKLNKQVTVYDPLVQNAQQSKPISYLLRKDFDAKHLFNNFDLVVINLAPDDFENDTLLIYKSLGGAVHSYVS